MYEEGTSNGIACRSLPATTFGVILLLVANVVKGPVDNWAFPTGRSLPESRQLAATLTLGLGLFPAPLLEHLQQILDAGR